MQIPHGSAPDVVGRDRAGSVPGSGSTLREIPTVTLRILHAIPSVPVGLICWLLQNGGAMLHRSFEVSVEFLDPNVYVLGMLAEMLGISVLRPGLAHHDDAIFPEHHLCVHELAVRSRVPKTLAEPEGFAKPGDGALEVLIKEVRSDARSRVGHRDRPRLCSIDAV